MGRFKETAGSSPGFWVFLYSVGTLSVFLAIFLSSTDGGRVVLQALGAGTMRILEAFWLMGMDAWTAGSDRFAQYR